MILHQYTTSPLVGEGGEVLKSGRRKDRGGDVPAWRRRPILCRHAGPGRVTWTPLLMHSERAGGLPRQRLLRRLPAIRSCCADDPFRRAAWWQAIEEEIDFWKEDDGLVGRLWARDGRGIVAKLRQVVPRPSKAGVEQFRAYRRQCEEAAGREEEQWQEA